MGHGIMIIDASFLGTCVFIIGEKLGRDRPFLGSLQMGSEKSALFWRTQAEEYYFRRKQLFVFGKKLLHTSFP
jgi:hypothetical protein